MIDGEGPAGGSAVYMFGVSIVRALDDFVLLKQLNYYYKVTARESHRTHHQIITQVPESGAPPCPARRMSSGGVITRQRVKYHINYPF